jgi:GT2 family glycosyltransferase
MKFGVVAIGRNEGERLRRCLASLSVLAAPVVYVDSGSTDGSVKLARDMSGVEVIELDMGFPFTAARARNAGLRRLREISPNLEYVQFLDGDCELIQGWLEDAISFLDTHANVAAVCGRRRERYPEHSIYNWLCDREWEGPVGDVRYFGGDVMLRVHALQGVDGYRDDLIAGEEHELCVRLRKAGWRIWSLDRDITLHDAAITRFDQWWLRALRSGYTFAQGVYLHGGPPEHHYVWQARRAWLLGLSLPLACFISGLVFGPWGWAAWLIYPLHMLQKIVCKPGPLRDRTRLALFSVLVRFPEVSGQIKFLWDRLLRRQARIIEYK